MRLRPRRKCRRQSRSRRRRRRRRRFLRTPAEVTARQGGRYAATYACIESYEHGRAPILQTQVRPPT